MVWYGMVWYGGIPKNFEYVRKRGRKLPFIKINALKYVSLRSKYLENMDQVVKGTSNFYYY